MSKQEFSCEEMTPEEYEEMLKERHPGRYEARKAYFENMSAEEFELLCREQLPALELYRDYVQEAIKKMKEKESEVKD